MAVSSDGSRRTSRPRSRNSEDTDGSAVAGAGALAAIGGAGSFGNEGDWARSGEALSTQTATKSVDCLMSGERRAGGNILRGSEPEANTERREERNSLVLGPLNDAGADGLGIKDEGRINLGDILRIEEID